MNNILKKGFTLAEILAVIIILGILVAFTYPKVVDIFNDVKVKSMILEENTVRNAAKNYVEDCFDTTTKGSLSGCAYTNILSDQGHVFVGDMVYDKYMEPVFFGEADCDGYVEFDLDKYLVCLRCGNTYKTDNLECTFDYEDTKFTTFNYSADGAQTFRVPAGKAGTYRIELWGAAGANGTNITSYGAYTSGVIELKENDVLYFYVGQQSTGAGNGSAFNAGTSSSDGWAGGGATDVRTLNGAWDNANSLSSRIMVAAGGGAGNAGKGAAGGGILGYSTTASDNNPSQLAAGKSSYSTAWNGAFGKASGGCGGGGGYYAGAGEMCATGASSGSSYISGHTGCVAIISRDYVSGKTGCLTGNTSRSCSLHYTGKSFTNTVMIDGNGYSWTNVRGNREQMPSKTYGQRYDVGKGNPGNGYARVTYLGA